MRLICWFLRALKPHRRAIYCSSYFPVITLFPQGLFISQLWVSIYLFLIVYRVSIQSNFQQQRLKGLFSLSAFNLTNAQADKSSCENPTGRNRLQIKGKAHLSSSLIPKPAELPHLQKIILQESVRATLPLPAPSPRFCLCHTFLPPGSASGIRLYEHQGFNFPVKTPLNKAGNQPAEGTAPDPGSGWCLEPEGGSEAGQKAR